MTTAPSKYALASRRARVAYELGRAKVALVRALLLTSLVGGVGWIVLGGGAAVWLPITLVVWLALEWRGGGALRGGRIGAGVGLLALTMPLWAFRSCCRAGESMMGPGCCDMTGACTAVGATLGLALAVFLVRTPRAERTEGAIGMGLALLAVASVRCGGLLEGEAVGLLGGLAAGALASSLVAALVGRLRPAA
jgi:hypothetical protein